MDDITTEMMKPGREGSSVTQRCAVASVIVLCLGALVFAVLHWINARSAKQFERELARMKLNLNWRESVPPPPRPEDNYYGSLVVRAWFPPKGTAAAVGKDEEVPLTPILPTGWLLSAPASLGELKALPSGDDERSLSALAEHFDKCEPGLRMLREAAKRPFVYLPGDYSSPERVPVPNYIAVRRIAQALTTRARVHLLQGRGDLVIEDLDSIEAVMRGLESKPALLVSAMIRVAVTGLYIEVVREGFQLGICNRRDLAALRARLEKIELIPIVLESVAEGEMMGTCYLLKKMAEGGPSERVRFLKYAGYDDGFRTQLLAWMPASSVRRNLLLVAELLKAAPEVFAADGSRFYPKKMASISERMSAEFDRMRLDNVFAASFVPNFTKASTVCAKNQTLIRLGIIACALEEYRTSHGGYPQTLEDLERARGASLPHDLITGTLPIYRLSDPTYELYSPGQDEKDDGGTAADWVFTPGQ